MEQVILVDELDNAIGVMEKIQAHRKGVLHRAFSIFVFNDRNEMLLQRRAISKYHSAGLWTNACCSHPRPGETVEQAAARRLGEEMGIAAPLQRLFQFTYQITFENGLIEHELDHVLVGFFNGSIDPDPEEVSAYRWMSLQQLEADLLAYPAMFTGWFHIAFPEIRRWWQANIAFV